MSRIFAVISGSLSPLLPAMAGAGFLKPFDTIHFIWVDICRKWNLSHFGCSSECRLLFLAYIPRRHCIHQIWC